MSGLGVSIAIIQDGRVLLIKREDFEVWGLPGGEIDPGESPARAAVREAYEETGFEVRLTRMVGLYTIPDWDKLNAHNVVFAAEITGGELKQRTDETRDAQFFTLAELPNDTMWWHEQRVRDALEGVGGSAVWTQHLDSTFNHMRRSELYAARDASGVSRSEFFRQAAPRGIEMADIVGNKDD